MGPRKGCETFFQKAIKNSEGKDMPPETIESLSIKFGLILDRLEEIKEGLGDLPCQDHESRIAKLEIQFVTIEKRFDKFELEKDKEIYPRLRVVEDKVTTLIQQNKGQDAWSAKIWVFIMLGIQLVFGVALYFLTRGGS